jgi:hypothetical protein
MHAVKTITPPPLCAVKALDKKVHNYTVLTQEFFWENVLGAGRGRACVPTTQAML